MSTRIAQILRQARQTLGDKDGDRWSDQDLLDLLDEGHKDYAHHAQILRGVYEMAVLDGQAIYTLPDDIFKVLRVEFDNKFLTISTYDEMDEHARNLVMNRRDLDSPSSTRVNSDFNSDFVTVQWQSDTAPEPSAIIFDKSNMGECRLYPIPSETEDQAQYTFQNESGIDLPFVGAELFGLVTAVDDYTFDSTLGVVTDLYDPFVEHEVFNQVEGVVTAMGESTGSILFRYIKTPDAVNTLTSDLLTPRAFDKGLKYYITGHALRNDLDTRNVERGNQELAFYERELKLATDLVNTNAVQSNQPRQTTYRGAF